MARHEFTAGATTFCEVLERRATEQPERRAFTYLADGEREELTLSYAEIDARARAVAARLEELGATGQRVLLLYPPGLDYAAAVFGCLYAGAVAVLVFPPHLNRPTPRLARIVEDAEPAVALTTAAVLGNLERRLVHSPQLEALRWLATDGLGAAGGAGWRRPEVAADAMAFLQYTSGSTGEPKGVMLDHGNLLDNLELIRTGFAVDPEADHGVIWLPMYHDMGLLGGLLAPVHVGIPVTLMSPAAFLQRPARWLEVMSNHRGTISGGPDFAYRLCADKVTEEQRESLDLSPWRVAFCGAERIHAETLDRFSDAFGPCGFRREAFYPCYGMAETTLIVSGGRAADPPVLDHVQREGLERDRAEPAPADAPGTRAVVGCGRPLGALEVAIVDPETAERLADGAVGEIWVAGPSVARGYWNRPEESAATFGAQTADGGGPFLRTGDLGYLRDGELYVTGRLKDLVIVRGQNHYPEDLERTAENAHPALLSGGAAAFSVEAGGEERLVLACEVDRRQRDVDADEAAAAVRWAIAENHELAPYAVVLVRTGGLPRTSSGKLRRAASRAAFEAGELKTVGEWREEPGPAAEPAAEAAEAAAPAETSPAAGGGPGAAAIRFWLVERLAARMGVAAATIDVYEPVAHFGLDSARTLELTGDLESWLGRRLPPTLFYEYPTIAAAARHLAGGVPLPAAAARLPEDAGAAEPIAIVGLGCRFPAADGPEEFWRLLRDGVDAVREVPPERFNVAALYDPDPAAAGKLTSRWGGFLEGIDRFDRTFFRIGQREAERMDPQQRLLLTVAWEALEDAGQAGPRLAASRTGVFVGISTNEYSRRQESDPELIDVYSGTSNALSIAANRLSYTFDLRGPSLAVDTACSSSLVAVHLACGSLQRGECDLALAAGVNVILSPAVTMSFSRAGALAADGRCKAFDARADGFVRSEGAGCVVLKPLSRAQADGDPIYALVVGSAVNQDGRTNGLMAPSRESQEAVLREAYARAGLAPGDVQYVEAHGTGTLLGDSIEAAALGAVLGEGRAAGGRCAIGSVKTNLGHLESAAGVAGLIKVALALRHRRLPASLHYREPNPHVPFDRLPLVVQDRPAPWPETDGPARAGVSSFGFGGTNAHLVIEEAPAVSERAEPAPPPWLLVLSAHTREALAARARDLGEHLGPGGAGAEIEPGDVCHTAAVRRARLAHRLALVAGDRGELLAGLGAAAEGSAPALFSPPEGAPGEPPRVAFVFCGQGPKWWGVGRELAATEPVFRTALEECDRLIAARAGWSLLEELAADEASSRLARTEIAQPALFALQVALVGLWRHWGVEPDAVVGHSVGEVAAAWTAGVLDLEAASKLVVERGRAMQAAEGGGRMAAVALNAEEAAAAIADHGDRLAVAAVNGPRSAVLSGEKAALEGVLAALAEAGTPCRRLPVNYAFHSPQVEPCMEPFAEALGEIAPGPPALSLYSTVSAERTGAGEDAAAWSAAYWRGQMRVPVRFAAAVERMVEDGITHFVEIAPQPVLGSDVAATLDAGQPAAGRPSASAVVASLRRGEGERRSMLGALGALHVAGREAQWDKVQPGRRVALPRYPWREERCWFEPAAADGDGWSWTAGDAAHPLLGRPLELAHRRGERVWQNALRLGRLPYLKDHRFEGAAVMPAAAYVEIGLAAAAAAGTAGEGTAGLAEVRFRAPLVLTEEGRRLQVTLAPEAAGARFQVFSRSGDGRRWTLHAAGRIVPETPGNGDATAPADDAGPPAEQTAEAAAPGSAGSAGSEAAKAADEPAGNGAAGAGGDQNTEPAANGAGAPSATTRAAAESPDAIKRRCARELSGDDFYELLRGRGFQYGPAFRGVTRLWRGAGEALGWIEAPPPVAAADGAYALHPALLDACGQVLVAAAGESGGSGGFLPAGLEALRLHGRPGKRMWSHARVRPGGDPGSVVGDARLLDEDGTVLVEARGLELRLLDGDDRVFAAADPLAGRLYGLDWEELAGDAPAAPPAAGTWLVFSDGGVGEALAGRLEAAGSRAVRIAPGTEYRRLEGGGFEVRPGSADDLGRLLDDALAEGDPPCRGAVHLWSLAPAAHEATPETLEEEYRRGCATALALVQKLAERRDADPRAAATRLWLVTRGVQGVAGASADRPALVGLAPATLWGFGRTVAQEHPALWGGLVDLDPGAGNGDADGSAAEWLIRRLAADDGETQVAGRAGRTLAARLVRLPAPPEPESLPIRPDGAYLISGGLGGLGLEVARWLVGRGARRLVLVGRAPLPLRDAWGDADPASRDGRRIAALRELEAMGASVHLAAVDVSDEAAFAAFLEGYRRQGWPPIRGVVHAAGVLQDRTLLQLDAAALAEVFNAKVAGAWLLDRLLAEAPLDFFVLFSSAAALLGSAGQANYAAANAFLDALAHHRRALGEPALAVDWGPWAEVGLAAREGARLAAWGVEALAPEEGLEALERLFAAPASQVGPQVGVIAVHWPRLFQALPEAARAPLFRRLAPERPEGEEAPATAGGKVREEVLAAPPEERAAVLTALLGEQLALAVGLPPSRLDPHQPLDTLGIDSLRAIDFKNRVEEQLGITVPIVDLLAGPSLTEFAGKLLGQLTPGAAAPGAAAEAPAAPAPERPLLLPLHAAGSLPPFFCVHPGALSVTCYQGVVRRLGDDRPSYALQPAELDNYRGLEGRDEGGRPLAEVARDLLSAIREVQPRGPYHLGGWSLGGVVAYLAALELRDRGEEVRLLALLDSPAPPDGGPAPQDYDDAELLEVFARFLGARCGKELPRPDGAFAGLDFDGRLHWALETARRAEAVPPDSGMSQIRYLYQVYKNGLLSSVRQLWTVEPRRYPGRITLFRTREQLTAFEAIFPDATERWASLSGEPMEVHRIAGDHYTMFLEPHGEELGATLGRCLAAAGDD
jgi:acyl transferase domain-containing protein/acyl-CoA synthetase (AMP-forming)/AMP-acid ligase II/thioesterase domain-containing protein/acyl carrier protein